MTDGFTRRHTTTGFSFLYRPMTPMQREELRRWGSDDTELSRRYCGTVIEQQIVMADWDGIPDEVFIEVFKKVTEPTQHEENLYRGAVLAFEYPHLANTTCRQCQTWTWFPLSGQLLRDTAGNAVPRQKGSVLLCQTPMGCQKGSPEAPIEFTPENRQAFEHYRMTGGAGSPVDELQAMNWQIIRKAEYDALKHRNGTPGRNASVGRHPRGNPPDHGRAVGRSDGRPVVVRGDVSQTAPA